MQKTNRSTGVRGEGKGGRGRSPGASQEEGEAGLGPCPPALLAM